jgi:NADH-quinone oxidoreductase subunit F
VKVAEAAAVAAAFHEIKSQAERHHPEWQSDHKPVIMVGTATCGRAAGALEVLKTLRQEVKKHNLDCPVIEVGCMGHCHAEPIVMIKKPGYPLISYGYVNPVIAERLVKDFILGDDPCLESVLGALEENDLVPSLADFPRAQYENKIILKNCGQIDPTNINQYIAHDGYVALAKALQIPPDDVIAEIKESGLRGRGGAGFPAGQKWLACRRAQDSPRYIICNGDEGDPGAFMDRAILESDPHSVIEGMIIAGYAVGAQYGYIYVRAEYPLAVARLETALRQVRKLNLLGKNILNSDFSFHIRLFQGSGAFVCGEATALAASIEGKPGTPRPKPPRMTTAGLFGKPTVVNNVKTLAFVPPIIRNGAAWFTGIGTKDSPGTAVFALAGKIGGPSGGCLPESALDLPVDFDSLQDAGAMMGSGGMVVLDEDDCMVEIARYFLEFTQRESCGKCTFCRLGTKQMLAVLDDITLGQGKEGDIETLLQLAEDVKLGSLCGLGKTAPNPVLTTLRYFKDEYEAHITEGRCPALMCRELIAYYILPDKCERSCDACVGTCTVEAITPNKKRIKVIDQEKCVKCNTCLVACPPQYNAVIKLSPPSEVPASK